MLDILLALNSGHRIVVLLEMDKHFDFVSARKSWNGAFAMLVSPPHQIIGDADIERASRNACKNVDEIGIHGRKSSWIAGSSPAMTVITSRDRPKDSPPPTASIS